VERKITPRTKAVIPVHLAGFVADMDRLNALAKVHNLAIVEDACHSWGGKWKGKGTGTLGACGVFSFQASKNITSAEGGIMLTDDEEVAEQCRSFTNVGRRKGGAWYEHFLLGSNLRLTEFQAALLLAQLSRLEEHTLKREANAKILNRGLRDIPGIAVIEDDPRITRRAYHLYCFRLDQGKLGVTRERFLEALNAEGAPSTAGYTTPLYKNPLFQHRHEGAKGCPVTCPYHGHPVDYTAVSCPVCEQVCQDTCWIFHTALLADEQDMRGIVAAVGKVVENIAEL
jgi:dTDP-4-amino-4,6-dideoxygalactose transaminase